MIEVVDSTEEHQIADFLVDYRFGLEDEFEVDGRAGRRKSSGSGLSHKISAFLGMRS